MGNFSKNAALLALGLWLGCALLFAGVVAPTLFNPNVVSGLSASMAGAISGAILRRIYVITYAGAGVAAFFLLIACLGEAKGARGPRRALILCTLALAFNATNDLWIHDRINKARVEMGNTDGHRAEGLRATFNQWHKASRWVYGITVGCGALAAVLLLPPASPGKPKKSSK
ncbi:MAG: DUF4149 domain-containing protein [Verrucomicrobia bacterium]|nr:DUF4149 domain-containing protein [Verrucomicrobiota bacterium]